MVRALDPNRHTANRDLWEYPPGLHKRVFSETELIFQVLCSVIVLITFFVSHCTTDQFLFSGGERRRNSNEDDDARTGRTM